MAQSQPTPEPLFAGDGELAQLVRSHDWSQTPLGALETWPDSLKTATQILLSELAQAQQSKKTQVGTEPPPPDNSNQTAVEPGYAEAQLRELETKYHALFESLDEGLCTIEVLFDANGRPFDHHILQANPAFERQSGIANPEGKRASELALGVEQYWNDLYAQVIHTGKSIRTEVRSDALDRWFEVLVSRVGDAATRQVAVVFTDIGVRKQAEATLRESEQRFRLMADAVPQIVWLTDPQGRVEFVNKQWRDYTGVPYRPMTVAEAVASFVHPDDGERTLEAFNAAQRSDGIFLIEHRLRSATGSYRWFLVRAEPYRDPQTGEIIRWFGASIDIHERKQTEAVLQESEELKRRILESSKDCIKVLTLEGRLLYLSAGGLHLLEIDDPASVLNVQWLDFWQGEDYQSAKAALVAAKAGHVGQFQGYAPTAKGNLRWWDVMVTPIRDASGRVAQLLSISRDITKQKQAEAEREQLLKREQAAREDAERANRIKDEFLAVLSHELRSPLNPILGWTHLLRSGNLDSGRQMDALATIERNAKLQSQLIEDLLDIARIMQGKLTLTATSVSLSSIIQAAVKTVRLAADAKNIQITLDLDPDVAPVSGDAARLQQMVWNLLINAVKFTDHGGQVTVQLRQVAADGSLGQAMAQIRVIDTGKGINPQFLPHVFEYFWQEDGSTTRKFGGLGLGLALVRRIVELHGGTVNVESGGEQQGATFIVQLPALQQATPIPSEQNQLQSASETRLDNVQILLVDDDTDTREFQSFLLEQHGATVTAVDSGLEVLQVLEQGLPDVIVSDIGMAEMDGYSLMQQIRSRPPAQGGMVPAIALTAYAADIDQEKALQAGFQTHLTKPLEPKRFVSEIITLLKPRRL